MFFIATAIFLAMSAFFRASKGVQPVGSRLCGVVMLAAVVTDLMGFEFVSALLGYAGLIMAFVLWYSHRRWALKKAGRL